MHSFDYHQTFNEVKKEKKEQEGTNEQLKQTDKSILIKIEGKALQPGRYMWNCNYIATCF